MEISGLRAEVARREHEWISKRIEDTFGPNPCKRTLFLNSETGEYAQTLCDSPRCPDCGPLKAKLLWEAVTTLGDQVTLVICQDDKDYKQVRDRIRKARQRHNTDYQYASWYDGGRFVITDAPLDGERIQLAQIKKRLMTIYKWGEAKLRKSWHMGSVTLSPRSNRKSGTSSAWKYFRKAGYTIDPGTWSDMKVQTVEVEDRTIKEQEHWEAWRHHSEPLTRG